LPHRKLGYLLNRWDSLVEPEEILRSLRVGAPEVDRGSALPNSQMAALNIAENIFSTRGSACLGVQFLVAVSVWSACAF
jgi:hypothetical protein